MLKAGHCNRLIWVYRLQCGALGFRNSKRKQSLVFMFLLRMNLFSEAVPIGMIIDYVALFLLIVCFEVFLFKEKKHCN